MKPPSSETACGKAPQSRSFSSIASNAFSTRPDIATASAQPQVANRKPQTSRETLLKGSASTMSRQMLPTSNHVPSQQTSIEPVARADSMKRQSFPSERAAYAEGISNELRPGVMPSPYQPPGVMPSPYQPPGVMPSSYHPHGVMPSPYQPHGVMPSPYQPHDAMPSPYQPPGVVPSPYQPPGVMPSPQAPDEPSSAEDGEIHEPKRLKMTTTTSTPQARVVPSGSSQFLQGKPSNHVLLVQSLTLDL